MQGTHALSACSYSLWSRHGLKGWYYRLQVHRSVSAASGPQLLIYDELYKKLSTTKEHVDKRVLSQMIRFFAAAIPLADQQLLSELYDSAKARPLSSTKASLREDEGLDFNGVFAGGTPSRCATV